MVDYINDFLENLKKIRRSEKTIKMYKYILKNFYNYVGDINPNDVVYENFEDFLYKDNIVDTTINLRINAIKSFYKFLENKKIISENHAYQKIKHIKVNQKIIEYFNTSEIRSLKRIIGKHNISLKAKTIITFILNTGVRNEELCNLKKSDIDLRTGKIEIIKGKGNKDRTIYVRDSVIRTLRKYYNDTLFFDYKSEYVFPGTSGRRLRERELNRMFERVSQEIKIHIYPHKLRHTFITQLADKNVPLSKIAFWVGHDSTKTTERYIHITGIDIESIAKQITI